MQQPAKQTDWPAGQSGSSSPVAIPSWLISLVLHGLLLFLVSTGLKSCNQLPPGDPEGGMREVGLHVRSANSLTERTDDAAQNNADESAAFQQPLDNTLQQPLVEESPPAALDTPQLNQPSDLIGAGGAPLSSTSRPDFQNMTRPNGAFAPTRVGQLSKGETSFFGVRDNATQFTYVLDASGSMAGAAIQAAKAELKRSIAALDATQKFQIIFYSDQPRVMKLRGGTDGALVWATSINKTLARQDIDRVGTAGGTDHMPALKLALGMRPEVVFFLTDADEPVLRAGDLAQIKRWNRTGARIHCIEFGNVPNLQIENFLTRLARQNGGSYLYRDVNQFKRKR